jgi:hypothetical protein
VTVRSDHGDQRLNRLMIATGAKPAITSLRQAA